MQYSAVQWVKNLSVYSLVRQRRKVGRFGAGTTSNGRLFHMGMVSGKRKKIYRHYLMGWEEYTSTGGTRVSVLWTWSATSARRPLQVYEIYSTSSGASCCLDGQQGTSSRGGQSSRLHCLCCENSCKCILQLSSGPFPVCLHFQLYVGSRPWRHIPEALLGIDMLVFLEFGMLS